MWISDHMGLPVMVPGKRCYWQGCCGPSGQGIYQVKGVEESPKNGQDKSQMETPEIPVRCGKRPPGFYGGGEAFSQHSSHWSWREARLGRRRGPCCEDAEFYQVKFYS